MLFVEDFMIHVPPTTTEDRTVIEAYQAMVESRVDRLMVLKENTLLGILTRSDAIAVLGPPTEGAPRRRGQGVLVRDVMTWNPITIGRHETIEQAAQILRQENIAGLPVVDPDGRPVGIIGEREIFSAFVQIMGIGDGARLTYSLSNDGDVLPSLLERVRNFDVKSLILFQNPRTKAYEAVVRIRGPKPASPALAPGSAPVGPAEPVVPVLDTLEPDPGEDA